MNSNYKNQVTEIMGTACAIVDIVTDAITKNAKSAGSMIDAEIQIKKKTSERAKLIYELGEDAFEMGKVNHGIVEQITALDEEIKTLKASRDASTN